MADDVAERVTTAVFAAIGANAYCDYSVKVEAVRQAIEAALRAEYKRGLEAAREVCNARGEYFNRKAALAASHSEDWRHMCCGAIHCRDAIAALRHPPPTPDPSDGKRSG